MSVDQALTDVAALLGVDKQSLTKLINFESGFRPQVKNPNSTARGLIQFTDATARGLGFRDSLDLVTQYPDIESQLRGPVLKYLSQYKPFGYPFPQSLYLSVFYPEYRYAAPSVIFDEKVRRVNPGIDTIQDYVNKVEKKNSKIVVLGKYSFFGFLVPVVLAAGYLIYNNYQRGRGDEGTGRTG